MFQNNEEYKQTEYTFIRCSLASADQIREWSFGEIKKAETINYRTFKPEKGGLFCEKIFGPTKDWECSCGKYKKIKYKGTVCDRCGVEVTRADVRRERMAHIELAVPVMHIWFTKSMPSQVSNILGLSIKEVEEVAYYESRIVIDAGTTDLRKKQLLSEQEFRDAQEKYGAHAFVAKMGGEALKELLMDVNLESEIAFYNQQLAKTGSVQSRTKIAKRLKIIEAFARSGNQPEWMVLDVLPVIPPELRPLVPLDGGRFATSDLNDLYRRVINRNQRLKVLMKIKTPEVILRNERRMLQQAVDSLLDNGKMGVAVQGVGNRPLKSLAEMLKGKYGRFRQNLLGKRVDYSGRSVIVVGPELKLNQCGLPKEMALTLFEPFIIGWLKNKGLAPTIPKAKQKIQNKHPEVWDALDDVVKNHPVMLNRAPTLHRLGIQAFEPVLIEGKAIRVHPLVCSAFNADFDGDQMAVHVPLSIEAQIEVKLLMMASDNIFLPQSGKPATIPSQDMILGLYHLMQDPLYDPEKHGERVKVFASCSEVIQALESGNTTLENEEIKGRIDTRHRSLYLQERIKVRVSGTLIETTPGRVIFNTIVPKELGFQNYALPKKKVGDLIKNAFKKVGLERTVRFLDDLKNLGFTESTRAAISMGISDISLIKEKEQVIAEARKSVREVEDQHNKGIITVSEKSNKAIAIWNAVTEKLSDRLMAEIAKPVPDSSFKGKSRLNPIHVMVDSGARGSRGQIKQLGAMRGLMAKTDGSIVETPVISCFREGLSVIEYCISSHGARKGLADTALKTADSGYLTRRLVDVAQDVIVAEDDCGTLGGIELNVIKLGREEILPLKERIVGRCLVDDLLAPGDKNEIIARRGDMLSLEQAEKAESAGIESVKVRSPLTCEAQRGVCARCYGLNLSTGKLVGLGEAIGIIAAQSIGEPGTQLTMRTFHLGGIAATSNISDAESLLEDGALVIYNNLNVVKAENGDAIVLDKRGDLRLVRNDGKTSIEKFKELIQTNTVESQTIALEPGSRICVKEGAIVSKGHKVASWDANNLLFISARSGYVKFEDIFEGLTSQATVNKQTGQTETKIKQVFQEDFNPLISIYEDKACKNLLGNYSIPPGGILAVSDGEQVSAGTVLAKLPKTVLKTKDITGGLPRVTELVEARNPKFPAYIAAISGVVHIGGILRGMRSIRIVDTHTGAEEIQSIPAQRAILVQHGDIVSKGQQLTSGIVPPQSILEICGVRELQRYLVSQVQEVYRLQGVDINDKHIEVIVRQMLQKVRITDSGDSTMIVGETIQKKRFIEANREIKRKGGTPARAEPVLLGITKAALGTESFIAAASFQETTRVLTTAACGGMKDMLLEPKANLIMGTLVQVGPAFKAGKNALELEEESKRVNIDLASVVGE